MKNCAAILLSILLGVAFPAVGQETETGQDPATGTQVEAQEGSDFVIGLSVFNNKIVTALMNQPSRRVIVLPFTDIDGSSSNVSTYITEQLITALAETGNFQVEDNRELMEMLRAGAVMPMDIANHPQYSLISARYENISVVVGTITDLQRKIAVMGRVVQGRTGAYVGASLVYLRTDSEIAALLQADRARRASMGGQLTPARTGPGTPGTPGGTRTPDNAASPGKTAERTQPVVEDNQVSTAAIEPVNVDDMDDVAIYRLGMDNYEASRFESALAYFDSLVNKFPDSPYADNAVYWMGECYYRQRKWEAARTQFQNVLDKYPYGNKVPAATLKRGYTEEQMGRTDDAIASMEELLRRFSKTPEADLARQKLQLLRASKQ